MRGRQILCVVTYMYNLKNKTNERTLQNSYRYRETSSGYQYRGEKTEGWGVKIAVWNQET